jgi:hypothetical protein
MSKINPRTNRNGQTYVSAKGLFCLVIPARQVYAGGIGDGAVARSRLFVSM